MTKPHPLIPVTLLTGFLGSGKTTVLNHLVQQPEMAKTLVIINEFGEIGLDHFLVAHSSDDVVIEMSSGCLCCTIRSDLVKTLRDITWRFARQGKRQFDRVIIETTGLADPVPVLHTLMTNPFLAQRYRLDNVVTVVDVTAAAHTLDAHPEAAKQIAVADGLLLTKADRALPQEAALVADRLRTINPAARQLPVLHGAVAARDILDFEAFTTAGKSLDARRWLNIQAYTDDALSTHPDNPAELDEHDQGHHHLHDVNRHDAHIRAYSFVVQTPIDEQAFQAWRDNIAALMGEQMLRIKAVLNIAGQPTPMVLHGVQHVFYPPLYLDKWPSDDRRSYFVFITRDIDRAAIARTFENVLLTA